MSASLLTVIEPTITHLNVKEFVARGFHFAERVLAENLIERHDFYVENYGRDYVLVGETVDLSTCMPSKKWRLDDLLSIWVHPPVPSQRTR